MKTFIVSILLTIAIIFGVYHFTHQTKSFGASNAPTILNNASNGGVAVGIASTQILPVNTSRQNAVIVNGGAYAVFLGFGTAAVVNKGVYLSASGGTYQMNDQNLFIGSIYGITSTQTSQVTSLEIKH